MNAELILEDGTCFQGVPFGASTSIAGEVVFNTGMVGYGESLSDPSYAGQILVFTYPLIGNYGIPGEPRATAFGHKDLLSLHFESERVHVKGVVLSSLSKDFSHWSAMESLNAWMSRHGIPGICGVDTRALTKRLRARGCMLGKIVAGDQDVPSMHPLVRRRLVSARVSTPQ